MKVSKKFRWEGAHRLPWHTAGCQHLHGHSYVLWLEAEGTAHENGMLIDFKILKRILKPLLEAWDHATLIAAHDSRLQEAIDHLASKHYILPYDSTSENLCRYVTDYLLQHGIREFRAHRIHRITVRIQETESSYAEISTPVDLSLPAEPVACAAAESTLCIAGN